MKGWECPKCGRVWAFWVKQCTCHYTKRNRYVPQWGSGGTFFPRHPERDQWLREAREV